MSDDDTTTINKLFTDLDRTDGEKYLLKIYNRIDNHQHFEREIGLYQSNSIQNKCLELMACTIDRQHETSINLMRKVMQLPNERLLDTFINKLCTFEYPISINDLIGIFLIESHQPEFVASAVIREAYVTAWETILEREEIDDLISFGRYVFGASTELLKKCCDNFGGFYNLIETVIAKHSKFVEHLENDDGALFWYFKSESLEANGNFNNFIEFICNLYSLPESKFSTKFLLFLKRTFPPEFLKQIFEKIQ